jgi:hypothetical protein
MIFFIENTPGSKHRIMSGQMILNPIFQISNLPQIVPHPAVFACAAVQFINNT